VSEPDVTDTVYARSPDVVWRLGPDRVVVRRVSASGDHAYDLESAAALVWISLDRPGTASDVTKRIVGAGLGFGAGDTDGTIRLLVDQQLVVVQPADH
jgi:hypothetical protein